VFHHACKLGLEGIVSKRRDSVYSSGRSLHWVKSKNPSAPAVRRELEEDWSGRRDYGQKNKARQQNASAFPS
jgi:ATP-dependent DNA ligase